MGNPREEKIAMKKQIMALLTRHGTLDYEYIVAKLKLETGFSQSVVVDVIKDMTTTEMVKIQDNVMVIHDSYLKEQQQNTSKEVD